MVELIEIKTSCSACGMRLRWQFEPSTNIEGDILIVRDVDPLEHAFDCEHRKDQDEAIGRAIENASGRGSAGTVTARRP